MKYSLATWLYLRGENPQRTLASCVCVHNHLPFRKLLAIHMLDQVHLQVSLCPWLNLPMTKKRLFWSPHVPFKKWKYLTLGPPSENCKCTFCISSQHPNLKLLHGGTGSLMILKTEGLWIRGTDWRSSPLDEHMGDANKPSCGGAVADAWKKIGSRKHLYIHEMVHVHLYLFILLIL